MENVSEKRASFLATKRELALLIVTDEKTANERFFETPDFLVGDKVFHQMFGNGVIAEVDGGDAAIFFGNQSSEKRDILGPLSEVLMHTDEKIIDGLSLDNALKAGIPDKQCFIYKISVGGQEYIGFTSQQPETRMKQHLEAADTLSTQKVHRQLRRFGNIYDFEIISEHKNEVLGLVAEISNIEKYKPELNSSIGGEGNFYNVLEGDGANGEVIFLVEEKDTITCEHSTGGTHEHSAGGRKFLQNNFYTKYYLENPIYDGSLNREMVSKYSNLVKNFYRRYSQIERKFYNNYISDRNYAPSFDYIIEYFFLEVEAETDTTPNDYSFLNPNPIILEIIAHFFYDHKEIREVKFDTKAVRNYVSERLKVRYLQNQMFTDWLMSNTKLINHLEKSSEYAKRYNIDIVNKENYYGYQRHQGRCDLYRSSRWNLVGRKWSPKFFCTRALSDINYGEGFKCDEIDRVFYIKNNSGQLTQKVFGNKSKAIKYLKEQSWFREGVSKNVFTKRDAFYPILVKDTPFSSSERAIYYDDLI